MGAFFFLIIAGVIWLIYDIVVIIIKWNHPQIKDFEKYSKESIKMSNDEVKKALRKGRW